MVECGEKNKCCCCCDLETGIKCLGCYLIFECVIYALVILWYTGNVTWLPIFEFILTLTMVIHFVWSIASRESLKAREYWLVVVLVYSIAHLVIYLHSLGRLYVTDYVEEYCRKNHP